MFRFYLFFLYVFILVDGFDRGKNARCQVVWGTVHGPSLSFSFFFLLGACFVEVRVASSSDHRTKSVVARHHRGSERGQVNRNATTTTESRLAVIENTLIAAPICGFNFSSLTSHLPMRRVETRRPTDPTRIRKEKNKTTSDEQAHPISAGTWSGELPELNRGSLSLSEAPPPLIVFKLQG